MTINHNDIVQARNRIAPYLYPTQLEYAPDLGENVHLKLENTNPTHSFKIRGALNAVLSLNDEERARGLVTASSGNHAQALAYASHLVGAKARILMPKHTPKRKVNGVKRYGAEAVLFGDNYDETEAEARRIEREEGLTFVSAYNDERVVAGAGTIGIEIIQQMPEVERVLVCVSGGGLIAGVATAIKAHSQNIEVIGVNALSAPSMYNLYHGTHYEENWDTLAEALSGAVEDGSITIPITKIRVDDIVLVSEEEIASAMRWAVDTQGWLVEGGGSVCIAALMHGKVPNDGRKTAAIVSGGNLDGSTLRKVLNA